jgi:sortase A
LDVDENGLAELEREHVGDPEDGTSETKINLFSKSRIRWVFNRLLLWVEIAAVFGLAFIFFRGFGLLRDLNQEAVEAFKVPTATSTPLITAVVLPSGHVPPNSPGGARPNDDEIPANLRPLVQSIPSLQAPTPGPEHATQIYIAPLWSNPQPIVQGDGWEQLKKGVGQHIGSGNPGEKGNMVLSAHNDIFGELFRNLDRLRPGDEISIKSASKDYVYVVTGFRIVTPTEVSVMAPSEKPTITLISCYPYLVDSQRIVVFGELKNYEDF